MSSVLGGKFTVALSKEFLLAFARIPQAQQMKVHRFVEKFQQAPDSPGINYEQITDLKDKNLRSVRIDLDYRAIVLKPAQGNVYVLLYVDHHDDAYRWARNKVIKINPEAGGLQIIDVQHVSELASVAEASAATESTKPLFDQVTDKQLLRLGVPEEFLPAVRAACSDDDVIKLCNLLPEEASDALYMLASGYEIEQIFSEADKSESGPPVDTEDFAAALAKPDSQRVFYVAENEQELSAALSAPLEQWRVFLHPSQRRIVTNNWNGPVRILGGAGTGKTVVAMHRAKWLLEKQLTEANDRILFTTFTANLAADIKASLAKLCRAEDLARVDVVNIDKWVVDYLKRNGYKRDLVSEKVADELWAKAVTVAPEEPVLDQQFFREEWQRVIQPNGVTDRESYLKASRAGRGIKLKRKERDEIWCVFEEYRQLLNECGLKEFEDATRDARQLLERQGDVLLYRAVIVDEAQDMGPESFKLIKQILAKDGDHAQIFIVGDAHQRIYGRQSNLSACGINIRGRARKLKINYRTTEETRRWAVALLNNVAVDDLDGGLDDLKGYQSKMHGRKPRVENFPHFEEEVAFICRQLEALQSDGVNLTDVCLVGRTDEVVERYERTLKSKGIQTYRIRRSIADERKNEGLRLATMHRVKGLQFEYVFIASANDKILPLEYAMAKAANDVSRREIEQQERCLLHVAATRAKRDVTVSSFGTPSKLVVPR
ncbi:MAG: DEAD/DEAH box helicase [Candidatus Obscuribacter sp.]|nr:DEAD/DEAH box helicase [Candidatus Obscuribacter sp.]